MLVVAGVRRILAPNSSPMTGAGTNTYLVGDRSVAVIDPGPDLPEHVQAILDAVAAQSGRIDAILVTHGHSDHLSAAYRLRDRTGAFLFGHPTIHEVDVPLHEGDDVEGVGEEIITHPTPGHAPDHLCFWLPVHRLLFSGDLVAGQGTVVLSRESGSLDHYLDSLRRMLALGPSTILPGHGPVVADGPAKLEEYLAHRARRESQILERLARGPATVDDLVKDLYAQTTPPALLPLAARNVLIHLDHLAHQGRASEERGRWSLRDLAAAPLPRDS